MAKVFTTDHVLNMFPVVAHKMVSDPAAMAFAREWASAATALEHARKNGGATKRLTKFALKMAEMTQQRANALAAE